MGAERTLTISQVVSIILICASASALLGGRGLSYTASLFAGIILTCSVLIILIFLILIRSHSDYFFYALVFLVSLSYAFYKQADFPFPYERHVIADMKILSDPDFGRTGIRYVARVRSVEANGEYRMAYGEIKGGKGEMPFMRDRDVYEKYFRFFPGEKVLLDLSMRKKVHERGSVIQAGGLFITLPHENAREYALHLRSRGIHALFSGYAAECETVRPPRSFSPPYSGVMFEMVALSGRLRLETPGPKNSTNFPTTP